MLKQQTNGKMLFSEAQDLNHLTNKLFILLNKVTLIIN